MHLLVIILLSLGLISFLLKAFNKPIRNIDLEALGLAFWISSVLIPLLIVIR